MLWRNTITAIGCRLAHGVSDRIRFKGISMNSNIIPDELITQVRAAQHIAVLTGAGVSAESGLPTFRDAMTGLWATYRPEELATRAAFQHNPELVWNWYAWRRDLVLNARPNPGHIALAELQRRVPRLTLITQNVDNLHQLAGSQNVIELHGNLRRVKCFDNDHIVDDWQADTRTPPHCPECGSLLRPDVVWFGETLPPLALDQAREAARHCDLFFSIGTSGQVEPAASLPRLAMNHGATVVIMNPDQEGSVRPGLIRIAAAAGVALPALVQAAWPQ
jgi:NAD-dependent deacetylase